MSAGPLRDDDLWCEESEEESGEYEDEDLLAEGIVGDGTGRPKANLTAYESTEYKVRPLWNGKGFVLSRVRVQTVTPVQREVCLSFSGYLCF